MEDVLQLLVMCDNCVMKTYLGGVTATGEVEELSQRYEVVRDV